MEPNTALIAEYVIDAANRCEARRKELGPTGTGTTGNKLDRLSLSGQQVAYVDVLRFIMTLPRWKAEEKPDA